jgi:signal transduction histidine kinase/HPt (histidine-containing phosphotransfer) domain-containing protein
MVRQGPDEPAAPGSLSTPTAAWDGVGWRLVAATLGLSIAGVAAPIAVAAVAATSGLLGPPLVASALVALLVLAPAGVGLATVLSGLRRLAAALAARGDSEAEQAVLRVLVDALAFFYALGLAAASGNAGLVAPYLSVTAFGLVAAWAMLLHVILWPAAPAVRRFGAMALDIVLLSAFLHCGASAVAGWYPLYLLTIVYAGFRFGMGALLATATLSILGFAAVVLSTDVWQQQPALGIGLILALAVLPGFIAGAVRALASAQEGAAQADTDRRRSLALIADNLRGLLAAVRSIPVLASAIGDVLDFVSLEAGAFTAPVEAFDLRALVKRSLVPLQALAAERSVLLRWRVDPHLPCRLRGRARALARILVSLASRAIEAGEAGTVRLALEMASCDSRRLRLRLVVESSNGDPEPEPADGALSLLLVRRLVVLMGGTFAIDRIPGRRARLAVTLALGIEGGAVEPILDLADRVVLIATEDEQFAGELAEPLTAWNGEARWLGDADAALAALSRRETTEGAAMNPVLIVDGRRKLLSALSLAHQAARTGEAAPFVLLVADALQIESLDAVDEVEVDGFVPVPLSRQLLANALDALPLGPLEPLMSDRPAMPLPADRPRPAAGVPPGEPAREFGERITPIAAHPKFVPEAAAVDKRAVDGLRALDGDPHFLGELIETFQADAQQLMERLDQAVAAADVAGFAQALTALRRAAAPLGGTQLCELLASLQGLTASELRQLGAVHVQRLDAEIDRLAVALTELLAGTEQRAP